MDKEYNTRSIIFIISVAFLLRLGLLLWGHPWSFTVEQQLTQPDSHLYHEIASTLLNYHRFAKSAIAPPDSLRTPIYPLFVAAVYALGGEAPWHVYVAQILIDCASCLLIFFTLRRILNDRIAEMGALIYAITPSAILYSASFLTTETLFVFVVTVVMYLFMRIRISGRGMLNRLGFGLLGILIGLAALVRPIALYVPAVLAVFVLVAYRRRPYAALRNSVLLIVGAAIMMSPWLIRNHQEFGRAKLTYIDSWDLLALDVGRFEAGKQHKNQEVMKKELLAEADMSMVSDGLDPGRMTRMEKADYWQRLAFQYIQRDPIGFLMEHVKGTILLLTSFGTSDFARALRIRRHPVDDTRGFLPMMKDFFVKKSPAQLLIGGAIAVVLLLIYVGLAVGVFVGWRHYDRMWLAFCILMVCYFIGIPGASGSARFRLPAMPFLMSFVGIGLAHIGRRWSEQTFRL